MQHEVDDDLGAGIRHAQFAHRVGAHRPALVLGDGEVVAPPVLGVGRDAREDAGCRWEHDLDARVERVAGRAELVEVGSAERHPHEVRRDAVDGAHLCASEHVRRARPGRGIS